MVGGLVLLQQAGVNLLECGQQARIGGGLAPETGLRFHVVPGELGWAWDPERREAVWTG